MGQDFLSRTDQARTLCGAGHTTCPFRSVICSPVKGDSVFPPHEPHTPAPGVFVRVRGDLWARCMAQSGRSVVELPPFSVGRLASVESRERDL